MKKSSSRSRIVPLASPTSLSLTILNESLPVRLASFSLLLNCLTLSLTTPPPLPMQYPHSECLPPSAYPTPPWLSSSSSEKGLVTFLKGFTRTDIISPE